jgi:hypothetical protein
MVAPQIQSSTPAPIMTPSKAPTLGLVGSTTL